MSPGRAQQTRNDPSLPRFTQQSKLVQLQQLLDLISSRFFKWVNVNFRLNQAPDVSFVRERIGGQEAVGDVPPPRHLCLISPSSVLFKHGLDRPGAALLLLK